MFTGKLNLTSVTRSTKSTTNIIHVMMNVINSKAVMLQIFTKAPTTSMIEVGV